MLVETVVRMSGTNRKVNRSACKLNLGGRPGCCLDSGILQLTGADPILKRLR